MIDRKSTRLNSSHTVIYSLSLHDALPIYFNSRVNQSGTGLSLIVQSHRFNPFITHFVWILHNDRSEEHTSELQSHSDLLSFPTRRSSDLLQLPCQSVGDWIVPYCAKPPL